MRGFFVSAVFVLLAVGTLGFDPLGKIRYEETVHPGQELFVYVNTVNVGTSNLDNVRVAAYIRELDVFAVSNAFSLENNGKHIKVLSLYFPPDTPIGLYLMQITMQNQDDRSVSERDFRYVWVG
jgi:hypothetical protein